ncbi:MAG TPA: glycosyltransferase [Anaeromyxobacteraceae bacterium]|nr:glycosyltransferase [Anaeromyxobacteraceae bacterium]
MSDVPFVGGRTQEALRIAMVIDSWDDAANGAVVSTRRFTDLLRRGGHEVTVLAAGAPAPGKLPLRPFYLPLANGIMRKMRLPFAWPARKILRGALSRQDVVHVQFPFYLGIRAVTLAREARVPVVASFHVQAEHLLYNVGVRSEAWIERVYRFFLRTVYDRSDLVICPSRFAEEELRSRGLRVPTRVISNGVPPEYRPLSEGRRARSERFVVLSVGRLAREKRHDLIIEAIRHSRHEPNIELVLLGDGPLRGELESKGKGLTHPPVVRFLPTSELIPYYDRADLYVHAAEVEVECMSVLEAMACGLPCLIARSPRSATPQFALSDAFLFEAGSRGDLTSKLDHLIEHRDELEASRSAHREAAGAYAIDRSLEKLVEAYREVTHRI